MISCQRATRSETYYMSGFEKGMGGRVLQGIFASRQAALIFPASQIQMLAGKLIFFYLIQTFVSPLLFW